MRTISSPQRNKARRYRLAPLATLPVFFTIEGKKTFVVGGSEAAAWKAELLAAAGAHVHILAAHQDLSDDMRQLAETGAAAGRIVLTGKDWQQVPFDGGALIVADLEEDAAPALIEKARGCAVPVNVIDKPAFCDFQFGSIVNRSPVVVGISTTGAAPILGQAVRRRVEALLPASLGQWGRIAQVLRERVGHIFAPGTERRSFWEQFVDLAFSGRPATAAAAETLLDRVAADSGSATGSHVTLRNIPRDPELMTLRDVRLLQRADLIFYDDQVSEGVLELARREARRLPLRDGPGEPTPEAQHIVTLVSRPVRGTNNRSRRQRAGVRSAKAVPARRAARATPALQ